MSFFTRHGNSAARYPSGPVTPLSDVLRGIQLGLIKMSETEYGTDHIICGCETCCAKAFAEGKIVVSGPANEERDAMERIFVLEREVVAAAVAYVNADADERLTSGRLLIALEDAVEALERAEAGELD